MEGRQTAHAPRIQFAFLVVFLWSIFNCVPAHSAPTTFYSVCYGSIPPDFSQCSTLQLTPQDACTAYKPVFLAFVKFDPGWVVDQINASGPHEGGCFMDFAIHNTQSGQVVLHDTISSSGNFWSATAGYFVDGHLSPQQCISCDAKNNSLVDPISPSTGAVFDTYTDHSSTMGGLSFQHYYDGAASGTGDLSTHWRHSFARNILTKYSTVDMRAYIKSVNTSSLYSDATTACTAGFADIQGVHSNWLGATALYSGGNCQLIKNGSIVASLNVYLNIPGARLDHQSTPIAYDVNRDDGQLIRFIIDGSGAVVNPPGLNLKLQKTTSGFTVTDSNDNIEQYDANGRLLSVTSRSGVVQTMNYDTSGLLSNVNDSFGHQLTFTYDTQGHLFTVTRQ